MQITKIIAKNSIIASVKEYSTFLLLFPTLVAGLKQFITLISINISLTTFFSVSFLVSEGVILTGQCIIIFFFSFLYRKFIVKYFYKKYKNKIPIISTVLVVIISPLYFLQEYITPKVIISVFMLIFFIFFSNAAIFLKKTLKSIILTYFGLILIIYLISSVIKNDPNYGVQNINTTTQKVVKKYKSAQLVFHNDLYLFYSTKKDDKNGNILVIKMEEIFNKDFEVQ